MIFRLRVQTFKSAKFQNYFPYDSPFGILRSNVQKYPHMTPKWGVCIESFELFEQFQYEKDPLSRFLTQIERIRMAIFFFFYGNLAIKMYGVLSFFTVLDCTSNNFQVIKELYSKSFSSKQLLVELLSPFHARYLILKMIYAFVLSVVPVNTHFLKKLFVNCSYCIVAKPSNFWAHQYPNRNTCLI